MISTSRPIALGVVMIAASATSSGCGAPGSTSTEHAEGVESNSSAIVNGWALTAGQVQTWGMIGVYHRASAAADASWFPRPCSGVVAKIANGSIYVLTARHCVTTDHSVNGAVFPDNALKLWSDTNLPLGTPPDQAVASSRIIAMPNPSSATDYARDFAVVIAPTTSAFQPLVSYRKGLFVGNPSQLNGHEYTAYGYGVSDPNLVCGLSPYLSTSAGVARNAGPFIPTNAVSSPPGGLYNFVNLSSNQQWLNCGDSGGADIAAYGPDDSPMDQIIGVHSTGMNPGSVRQSAMVTPWVQQQLGGVYLFSDQTGQAVRANGSSFNFTPAGSSTATPFLFNADIGQLNVSGTNQCLGVTFSVLPQFKTCNTSDVTQQWTVSWDRTIRSSTNQNKCLVALSATQVRLATCNTGVQPQQLWLISAQN